MRTKRVLLVSCSVILLCVSIIVGMTYALFTDQVSVQNHLRAGTLDVTLKRTSLEYTLLNEDGYLEKTVLTGQSNELDLTTSTDENVFGLSSDTTKIVPGSYFDATLVIGNNGDVAFDYSVEIKLLTENGDVITDVATINELSKQLKVYIKDADGNIVGEYMLSDLCGTNNCEIKVGHMKKNETEHKFGVMVEFVDCADNNSAKAQKAVFDLVVTATQASAQN